MELQTAIHRQCPRPLGQYPKMTNRFRVSYGYGVTIFQFDRDVSFIGGGTDFRSGPTPKMFVFLNPVSIHDCSLTTMWQDDQKLKCSNLIMS